MFVTFNDLSDNAKAFAQHCLQNCDFKDVVKMVNSGKHEEPCARFNITEEQWQNAVYVVIKEMGRR